MTACSRRSSARLNKHGVPQHGLIIVAALMTLVLFGTMSPTIADQFNRAVDLAVILIIVPYIYSIIALVNLLAIQHAPAKTMHSFITHRDRGAGLLPVGGDRWR